MLPTPPRSSRHASTIDVLHYNTGVLHRHDDGSQQLQPITAQNAASIASDIAINIAGALVAIGSILPALRANGGGSVLLTGGGLGKHPPPIC